MWKILCGCFVMACFFWPVLMAYRGKKPDKDKQYFPVPVGMKWLQWTAVWILEMLPENIKNRMVRKKYWEKAADRLYPGMDKKKLGRRYEIGSIMLLYGVILLAVVGLVFYSWMERPPDLNNFQISREDATGMEKTVELEAEIDGLKEKQQLVLTIQPRKYSKDEINSLMEQVKKYIDKSLPGENSSLQQITEPLCLPDTFPGENILIEWQFEDYQLIHQDGTLGDLSLYQLPVRTNVTAVITYEDVSVSYMKELTVVQKEMTTQEKLYKDLVSAVTEADLKAEENLQFQLPSEVDGHTILWRYQWQSGLPGLIIIVLCVVLCLPFYQAEMMKKQLNARREQLLYDYPGFVHRMVLMMGAGMTVRRSMEELLKDEKNQSWLHKEMSYALHQMQAGIPEIQVYLNFGRRTELPQYVKFSQLMIQKIKKGDRGIRGMMMQEVYEVEKQRRDMAKQLGETAGTKLLFPMMLLLTDVLMIIMVPAWMTM